jgi:hypothetical protein
VTKHSFFVFCLFELNIAKETKKKLRSVHFCIFVRLQHNICVYSMKSTIPVTLNSFCKHYIGNVQNSPLGVGKMMRTGHFNVEDKGQNIKLTSWSLLHAQQEITVSKSELEKFFTSKKQMIRHNNNNNDVVEERVSFMHYVEDSYGFFHQWLGGLTSTVYGFQLKFIDGNLSAFRIQRYNTGNKEKLLYLLEVNNVLVLEDPKPEVVHQQPIPDERKDDWDF